MLRWGSGARLVVQRAGPPRRVRSRLSRSDTCRPARGTASRNRPKAIAEPCERSSRSRAGPVTDIALGWDWPGEERERGQDPAACWCLGAVVRRCSWCWRALEMFPRSDHRYFFDHRFRACWEPLLGLAGRGLLSWDIYAQAGMLVCESGGERMEILGEFAMNSAGKRTPWGGSDRRGRHEPPGRVVADSPALTGGFLLPLVFRARVPALASSGVSATVVFSRPCGGHGDSPCSCCGGLI